MLTFAAILSIESCTKRVETNCGSTGVYSKWSVASINTQSYLFPIGLTWDSTYNAAATDYIDLSTKGEIIFYINQQQHIDTYDTTKYNLINDTLVTVNNSGELGSNYVSLIDVSPNSSTLVEETFGIDTKSKISYNLKK